MEKSNNITIRIYEYTSYNKVDGITSFEFACIHNKRNVDCINDWILIFHDYDNIDNSLTYTVCLNEKDSHDYMDVVNILYSLFINNFNGRYSKKYVFKTIKEFIYYGYDPNCKHPYIIDDYDSISFIDNEKINYDCIQNNNCDTIYQIRNTDITFSIWDVYDFFEFKCGNKLITKKHNYIQEYVDAIDYD